MRQATAVGADPFDLEPNDEVMPGTVGARLRTRAERTTQQRHVLSTSGKTTNYGFFWRRSGDLWVSAPVEWHFGPDDAVLTVTANRTERARSVRGWSSEPKRVVHVPLGGSRFGPMFVQVELTSSAPAEVEFSTAKAVNGFVLPAGSEIQAWVRPILFMIVTVTSLAVFRAVRGLFRRLAR